ncbi:MAG: type II toxin-antitoxin system RelE/ParE family toxin [Candidatus Atribacteria bacterium]|nr:type II toxin-antitoxin system RelE/ParE family toxin [Candidatus Atribacteria bacterium]
MYKLFYKQSIKKDIKDIPDIDLQRIMEDIKTLKSNPLPAGVKKIKKGNISFFRIRKGNYRIGYHVYHAKKEIVIIFIKRRNEGTY